MYMSVTAICYVIIEQYDLTDQHEQYPGNYIFEQYIGTDHCHLRWTSEQIRTCPRNNWLQIKRFRLIVFRVTFVLVMRQNNKKTDPIFERT